MKLLSVCRFFYYSVSGSFTLDGFDQRAFEKSPTVNLPSGANAPVS